MVGFLWEKCWQFHCSENEVQTSFQDSVYVISSLDVHIFHTDSLPSSLRSAYIALGGIKGRVLARQGLDSEARTVFKISLFG